MIFKVGGMWLKKLKHARIPIVLGTLLLVPTLAQAKGPIVRASADWLAVFWTILINNT